MLKRKQNANARAIGAVITRRAEGITEGLDGLRTFDFRGAPAPLLSARSARLLLAFPITPGVEDGRREAPSTTPALQSASCESTLPLIPPLTLTRLLAVAPSGRLVTCSATCRDA
jgi:hypothetical protein